MENQFKKKVGGKRKIINKSLWRKLNRGVGVKREWLRSSVFRHPFFFCRLVGCAVFVDGIVSIDTVVIVSQLPKVLTERGPARFLSYLRDAV